MAIFLESLRTRDARRWNHWATGLLALALAWLSILPAPSAAANNDPPEARRPRIGLVLGGGGARGAAHVGVRKVLEELRIPVDYIAGTSMGSIVGGLYASGMSPEEIEREMETIDWNDLFQDYPSRAERSFHRKRDDDFYAFKAKPGFNRGKIQIPLAYIRGQKFDLQLNRLTLPVVDVKNFDNLPIPYRAVAADLETGQEVVLAGGSLAQSIRASMAVPGAFDPAEINGRLLVDGGIANNVPVSVARSMGADVLIVVDVGTGLYNREEIRTALDVTGQLSNFLFSLNAAEQIKTLGPQDVLIRPSLGDITSASFNRVADAFPLGEKAARAKIDALRRYSLTPEQYARYRAARSQRRPGLPVIDFVRIDNRSHVDDAVIADRISAKLGEPLDVAQLELDIGQIYGLEIFESVRYELVREDGKTGLLIHAKEKYWGPGYLQFGLAIFNTLEGDTKVRFGTLYTRTQINGLNGEWRLGLQLGDEPGVFTGLYQPLDPLSRYFASGQVGYRTRNVNVFDKNGDLLSRSHLSGAFLELGFGREFGTWGEGRLGYRRESGRAEVSIGPPAPDIDLDLGELFLRLSDDTLNDRYFPRTGHFGHLEYRASREPLGANVDYDQVLLDYTHAFSWGSNTIIGAVAGSTTLDDNAPLEGLFQLGGFSRLSGLQEDQLTGQHAGLAELAYLRRLYRARFFETYVGASLELGNVWQRRQDISLDNTIFAGSMFLGFYTPIGPVYVAYGRADTSDQAVYIYIGPRFTF